MKEDWHLSYPLVLFDEPSRQFVMIPESQKVRCALSAAAISCLRLVDALLAAEPQGRGVRVPARPISLRMVHPACHVVHIRVTLRLCCAPSRRRLKPLLEGRWLDTSIARSQQQQSGLHYIFTTAMASSCCTGLPCAH